MANIDTSTTKYKGDNKAIKDLIKDYKPIFKAIEFLSDVEIRDFIKRDSTLKELLRIGRMVQPLVERLDRMLVEEGIE